MNLPPVRIADEVGSALASGGPVVAIESTVIAHGLPAPANRAVADAMSAAVREEGAVPAMIGVIRGEIAIGLDAAEITRLADGGGETMKLSRRDLPYAVAAGRDGGTTVSATMICAALAGIRVMATGGIGGVHRGAESTMDVSADLEELARTNVAVVCSGAKAVLDLPRTLEYLETRGVPVIGFGTDAFPAFFVADSGLPVPARADTAEDVARLMAAKWRLKLDGGLVIARPPPPALALEPAEAERLIRDAVAEAESRGVTGKAVTPFLLERIAAATEGRSVEANTALLEANARLAARIARAWAALDEQAR